MTTFPRLLTVLAVSLLGTARVSAGPREELLRAAPPDAALVLVVQNARDHLAALSESPFAQWFPTTQLGKQLFDAGGLRKAQDVGVEVFGQLGVTPDELVNDVIGDAVVFAFTPPSADGKTPERAVILVRPRKPETLRKVIGRLDELQTKSGELKGVARREHNGEPYSERQKSAGGSEFYCLRGGVFAFSESEADVRGVIDRERAGDKSTEFADRITRLGVADAAAVLLVNPRAFDAEVRAKAAAANKDEKAFLARFEEVWKALDAAAVYLDLGRDLELGAVARFNPESLPAGLRPLLAGPRTPSALWAAVPDDALFAAAGRVKVSELIETLAAVLPDDGKKSVREGLDQFLGPVFGKDKLAAVLDALGPDWAVWAAPPPPGGGFLPVGVAALRVRTDGPAGAAPGTALVRAVEFGLQMARFAYNREHADQIEWREVQDGETLIRSLANDKAFPTGFRPSFALKGGYLLLATSPEAIQRFRPPATDPKPGGEVPLLRFSGAAARAYLTAHREPLAKFLTGTGAGAEKDVLDHLDQFTAVLELVDRVELLTRGDDTGSRLAVRVRFAKPLKK